MLLDHLFMLLLSIYYQVCWQADQCLHRRNTIQYIIEILQRCKAVATLRIVFDQLPGQQQQISCRHS